MPRRPGRPRRPHGEGAYLEYRPLDHLAHVDCPVYVVHGARDTAVAQFQKLGKANLTYRRYPDLDHRWTDERGTSHFREVGLGVLDWIVARVARSRS